MNFTYKIEFNDTIKITAVDKLFNNYVCELDVSYLNTNVYSMEILFNMLNDHIEKMGIEEDNIILNAIYKDDKIYMTLDINYRYNPSKIDFVLEKVICNTEVSRAEYLERIIPELMFRISELEHQTRLNKLFITDKNLAQYTKLFISPYEILISIGDTDIELIDKKIGDFDAFMCDTNGLNIFKDFVGIDTVILYNVNLDFNIFNSFELKHLSLYSCNGEIYKQYVYGLESLTLIDTPMDYSDLDMEIIVSPELIKGRQQRNVRIHEIYDIIKGEFTDNTIKHIKNLWRVLRKYRMYIIIITNTGYHVPCKQNLKPPKCTPYNNICIICDNPKKLSLYINRYKDFDIMSISKLNRTSKVQKIYNKYFKSKGNHYSTFVSVGHPHGRCLQITESIVENVDMFKHLME